MDSITSFLAQSRTVKTTYEFGRRKVSEAYRRVNAGSTGRYEKPDGARNEDVDFDRPDPAVLEEGVVLVPHPEADNPVLTADDVTDCLARFVADPFVVYWNGRYHMFFEIMSVGRQVFIGHAFSENALEYEYNRIVVQPETAQHTYPHVFRRDGKWWLVPSPGSNVAGEFRVYEAVEFPTEWRLAAPPVDMDVRLDPTPIFRDDTVYLLYQERDSYDVVLKYADSLTGGSWTTHPSSPVIRNDPEKVREPSIGNAEMVPSGRPLYVGENVHLFYRSHADRSVYHYRITELDQESFAQERHSDEPVFDGQKTGEWNRRFMHTVNPAYPAGIANDVVAVDGLRGDSYVYSIGIYTMEAAPRNRSTNER